MWPRQRCNTKNLIWRKLYDMINWNFVISILSFFIFSSEFWKNHLLLLIMEVFQNCFILMLVFIKETLYLLLYLFFVWKFYCFSSVKKCTLIIRSPSKSIIVPSLTFLFADHVLSKNDPTSPHGVKKSPRFFSCLFRPFN